MVISFQKAVAAAVIDPEEKGTVRRTETKKDGSRLADLPLLVVVILETSSRLTSTL